MLLFLPLYSPHSYLVLYVFKDSYRVLNGELFMGSPIPKNYESFPLLDIVGLCFVEQLE